MNILGYRLRKPAPIPLARNVTVSPTPRALGLFLFTKSPFLRRAAAHASSLFCVWARRQGRRTNQPPRGNG